MTLNINYRAMSVISKQFELIEMSNKKIYSCSETKWNSDDLQSEDPIYFVSEYVMFTAKSSNHSKLFSRVQKRDAITSSILKK